MSYQDREIMDSNIADLSNDQMRSRKTFKPRGWFPFREALNEVNVPNDLIDNQRRLNITTGSNGSRLHKSRRKKMDLETCVNGRRVLQSL